ncbi:hypothetical protein R3P38DRAFT_3194982 [Favolaschia claudopus]|uniref:HMG box domain-containing protein n=1 Tax=Favolaschia claudopus TaxID=2862362 RepID=A0AAW0BBM8_9AGAR
MLSILNARLLSRLSTAVARQPVLLVSASRLPILVARRSFITSIPLAFPAVRAPAKSTAGRKTATTAKKTAAKKKPATKKKAAPKKKPAAKKVATKKKAAPKKAAKPKGRVAAKKPVVKKSTRVTRAQAPPPRGPSPFILFSNEYGKNHKDVSIVERAKLSGAAWRALSEEEKQPYVTLSAARSTVAQEERTRYFASVDPDLLRRLNKQRIASKKNRIPVPRILRKPPSSFFLFLSEIRDPSLSAVENAKSAGAAWKTLPESEKEVYRERCLELTKEHKLKLEERAKHLPKSA